MQMIWSILVFALCSFSCNRSEDLDKNKEQLRVNIYTEPPTLDPRKMTDTTSAHVLTALFEGLTRIGFDNEPHPALAEKIEISDDRLTYRFTLRKAFWSNGDPVIATDFVFAWKSLLDPLFPAPFAYKLFPIANAKEVKNGKLPHEKLGVRALDEKTLEVTLTNPTPYFLELCAFPTFYPLPEKVIRKKGDDWLGSGGENYIVNGPFRLALWTHESEIQLTKNPTYWDASAVRLGKITMTMIDDSVTEYYMFEMGELDWAGSPLSGLPTEILPSLRREGKVISYPISAIYFYKINTELFPCVNVNIRKALCYAINRQAIVEHILQAGQIPAEGMIPPMPGFEHPIAYFQDHDVLKARAYFAKGLAELGLTRDTFPTLTLSYNTNREHQKIAQAIQQQWFEVLGVKSELSTFDWKVYLSRVAKMEYQIARSGWIVDFLDPLSILEPFKYRDSNSMSGNETGWTNAHYTAFLDQSLVDLNLKNRAELLRQAEKILVDETPVIPIFYIVYNYLKKPYVKNVYLSPTGGIDFKEAYIQREAA